MRRNLPVGGPANPSPARFLPRWLCKRTMRGMEAPTRGEGSGGSATARIVDRSDPERFTDRVLDGDHAELARTLDELIKNNFEKGRVAAALPVHRNTLRDRIARISELTGVDLDSAEGRGLAWLAWRARVFS